MMRDTEKQLLRELRDSGLRVEKLLAANERVTKDIEELREGACRYHCRTAKENYCAGFRDGQAGRSIQRVEEEAWREYTASN